MHYNYIKVAQFSKESSYLIHTLIFALQLFRLSNFGKPLNIYMHFETELISFKKMQFNQISQFFLTVILRHLRGFFIPHSMGLYFFLQFFFQQTICFSKNEYFLERKPFAVARDHERIQSDKMVLAELTAHIKMWLVTKRSLSNSGVLTEKFTAFMSGHHYP